MNATLVLENGAFFTGTSFGSEQEAMGEVVFTTGHTGYQETLTDPSYAGQIVVMTCPMVGNVGVNPADVESARPQVSGLVVREYVEPYSNFRARGSLGRWLADAGIPGLHGVDTRMLTRIVRSEGAMRAVLSTGEADRDALLSRVLASPVMTGRNLAEEVTCREPYVWQAGDAVPFSHPPLGGAEGEPKNVVAVDFGIKRTILRRLSAYGCRVTVVPATTPAADILSRKPDGVFLSNGPGDPAAVPRAVETIRRLLGTVPLFGICLGHQLLALALGARTFKLPFGHRGGNHPVKNLLTGAIEITAQNHGFAVDPATLDPGVAEVTHVNLNDGTNEGLRHRSVPAFSVQYHPEASPGPHDSDYLFRDFIALMRP